MRRIALHIANGLLLVLFAWAAAMQYNDPDPVLWTTLYGTAALCCVLYMADRLPVLLAAVLSGVYVLGALYLTLRLFGPASFFDDTGREMMGLMEDSREMLGLWIAAAWTGFLGWLVHRQQRAAPPVGQQPETTGA